MSHVPVLKAEVVEYLLHDGARRIVDGTVGAGGHAEAILSANSRIQLIGIDRDPAALALAADTLAPFGVRVRLERALFADLDAILGGERVDGILLDLGVSSMQIDQGERGFSYRNAGPLDMRMGDAGDAGETLKDFLSRSNAAEIAEALRRFGELRGSRHAARAIKRAADAGELESTADLARVISSALRDSSPSVLSRAFQGLRVALNREIELLERFLASCIPYLEEAGRLVVISYHSLEDRLVKDFMRGESAGCVCPPGLPVCVCSHEPRVRLLTRRAVKAGEAEIASNPRSRSARLRAAEVIAVGGVN